MKNWDDLRYLVAVHKTGSMSAAARLLDTNPATVSRRLARLSETLGFDLFLKTPQGWTANEAITDLIESITAFENEIESYLNARDQAPDHVTGHINIGCPPSIASFVLFPGLRQFLASNPGLEITFTGQFYQDALGDNDLFVSAARPQQGRLVVRYIGKYHTNVYCYEDSPRDAGWIGLHNKHDRYPPAQHARNILGGRDPVIRVESLTEVLSTVQGTRLPGLMPTIAATQDPRLVPFDPESEPLQTPLYLCFHETRRKDPLLQLVADWIAEQFNGIEGL
ncbi:LysR family transcriptional regulator [Pseudooceanicola sp. CBS1P-1]|uniref:LysR family transcriptional regulator n=1 Tax=Pseudooceanicola albus TaxID=2692189 RepID=A0A6L7FX97_9RHOB|nr:MULTISPECIES: LysR family transcriptional regulator [Pseudooceanicola]MBT9383282.1 LysR family transcriptional regulator [Pseudooceanicola endophyticus]MXN16395.1 LysR family transcriptional regulator [Pseudooceanicola albus]